MNRLTALLYLRDPQTPTANDLRDQANKTFVAMIENFDFLDGVLEGLADAYVAARDNDVKVESGDRAESIFLLASLKGYREHFPETEAGSEAYSWWPDGMNVNREWPVVLLKDFGYLAGYRDGMVAKELQRHAQAMHQNT